MRGPLTGPENQNLNFKKFLLAVKPFRCLHDARDRSAQKIGESNIGLLNTLRSSQSRVVIFSVMRVHSDHALSKTQEFEYTVVTRNALYFVDIPAGRSPIEAFFFIVAPLLQVDERPLCLNATFAHVSVDQACQWCHSFPSRLGASRWTSCSRPRFVRESVFSVTPATLSSSTGMSHAAALALSRRQYRAGAQAGANQASRVHAHVMAEVTALKKCVRLDFVECPSHLLNFVFDKAVQRAATAARIANGNCTRPSPLLCKYPLYRKCQTSKSRQSSRAVPKKVQFRVHN